MSDISPRVPRRLRGRRWFAAVLCAAGAVGFVACGGDGGDAADLTMEGLDQEPLPFVSSLDDCEDMYPAQVSAMPGAIGRRVAQCPSDSSDRISVVEYESEAALTEHLGRSDLGQGPGQMHAPIVPERAGIDVADGVVCAQARDGQGGGSAVCLYRDGRFLFSASATSKDARDAYVAEARIGALADWATAARMH